jgi:hypothetical protein
MVVHLDGLDGRVGIGVKFQGGQGATAADLRACDSDWLRLLRYAECHIQQVQQQPCKRAFPDEDFD